MICSYMVPEKPVSFRIKFNYNIKTNDFNPMIEKIFYSMIEKVFYSMIEKIFYSMIEKISKLCTRSYCTRYIWSMRPWSILINYDFMNSLVVKRFGSRSKGPWFEPQRKSLRVSWSNIKATFTSVDKLHIKNKSIN